MKRPPCEQALQGFEPAQIRGFFAGLFPVDSSEFEDLREAMAKLRLNDASFDFEMETSAALGFGFRCGFLGFYIWRSSASAWSANSILT